MKKLPRNWLKTAISTACLAKLEKERGIDPDVK